MFDYNGTTLTKVAGSNTTSYTWDENRLTSVTLPGNGGTVSLAYDPFGRRIKKVTPSTTSVFRLRRGQPHRGKQFGRCVVARYSQGLDIDEPLAMLRSGATSYYDADGLARVTQQNNAELLGNIWQQLTYRAGGNALFR